jgi:hypothetical protein
VVSPFIVPLDFFQWGYVKDIVSKTPLTTLDELKLRNVTAIGTITLQMLENAWKEIKYHLNIMSATKAMLVGVV